MSDGTLFIAFVSISSAKIAFLFYCRRKKLQRFEKIGTIKSINQFPVKSGGPIHLDSAKCTVTGLHYNNITDRHWMVIRRDGAFLDARKEPKLVLIKPSLDGNNLLLDAPGMRTLVLPKCPPIDKSSKLIKCRVWDEYITGLFCGEDAKSWIAKYLGYDGPSIVVSTPSMEKRDSSLVVKEFGNPAVEGDLSAFSNFGAYMILSQSSLDDLNTRLEKKVTMTRFRPNITIDGCGPYDEDNWAEMRIGNSVYMRLLDLCGRCILTAVDPATGEKDAKRQPLETLKSYRCVTEDVSPCFGVNAAIDIEGEIQVGDPVYVIRK
ncbi:mitochondrial amidoxime-reducing component 1-like isoform X1 [Mytilus californianus]|uniref:mitochondrial amidoxime-reducing component 1-like isoform X1 n=1 Tax=Mytilus californianus TaxID=6549 RepID=UPI002245793B|nr:mitochondrial amidoxime-reducing component 1-like isoform X1 [Mytilus californianus]